MKIRKAKLLDAKKISYLIRKNIEEVKENQYGKKEVIAWKKMNTPKEISKKMKEKDMFVITKKNKILGTITLKENLVGGFFIRANKRGQGIGSKLLNFIQRYAKKKGHKKLKLTSSPSALKYYKRRGFKPKGIYYFKVNEKISLQETKMEKTLK